MLTLLFRPEGVEPTRADFRIMGVPGSPPKDTVHFTAMEQAVAYLTDRPWPEGCHPWIMHGDDLLNPDEVMGLLPN